MFRWYPVSIALAALFVTSCNKSSDEPILVYTHQSLADSQQRFQVRGVVVEVNPAQKSVTLQHDEIPGYMSAMTMPFEVKDTNLLAGLEAGDPVSFRLIVTETNGYIDRIEKLGPKTNSLPAAGGVRVVREVPPLEVGDLVPEYPFTNQLAQSFSTARFKGQALAVEFLFTRCPFPTFCPFMADSFETAQRKLLAMTNGPANWHLLTLSFDPDFDTPDVLKEYAESHHYDSNHWTFATGNLADITALGDAIGLVFWHDENGGISHNLRAAVIDASGRLQKVFAGNKWTPDDLVSEIVRAAGPNKAVGNGSRQEASDSKVGK
jgi:protein SCO1